MSTILQDVLFWECIQFVYLYIHYNIILFLKSGTMIYDYHPPFNFAQW